MHEEFAAIFAGYDNGYGTYVTNEEDESRADGKRNVFATTHRARVEEEHWRRHLEGTASLGIIPIDREQNARWGCIDIDSYKNFDGGSLAVDIAKRGWPLVVCRSKSGGAHVFLLLKEPAPASLVKNTLQQIASALGYGSSEVFPKQIKVDWDNQDMGNWLNLPYFDANRTNRYAYNEHGQPLTLEGFLARAKELQTTPGALRRLNFNPTTAEPGSIQDEAPPCLQQLWSQGFPEGSRNKGLYNLAVFLRKAAPENWQRLLLEYNDKYMAPPLDAAEVSQVMGSVSKRDYKYTCNDSPIRDFCNRGLCLSRRYGVSGSQSVSFADLAKIDCTPPVYFLSVDDRRIRLSSIELLDYLKLRRRVMEAVDRVPPAMKATEWTEKLNELFIAVNVIEAGAMPSDEQLAKQCFLDFLHRGRIKRPDEILDLASASRNPIIHNGVAYFSWLRFVEYYKRNRERGDAGVLPALYNSLGIERTDHPEVQKWTRFST